MPWPALDQLVKCVDFSIYQNSTITKPDWKKGRTNWINFATSNPEVKVVIVRLSGNKGGPDWDFQYNYDGAEENGYKVAAYGFASPARKPSQILRDWWQPGLGDRKPKLIILDCEISDGRTPPQITKHVRDFLAAIRDQWPDAEVWLYTAQWWWEGPPANIVPGWENEERWWIGHYPYLIQQTGGVWRVAWTFAEADRLLPIHNNFTPYLPKSISIDRVDAWQFTSRGIIYPTSRPNVLTPRVDLTYMRLSAYTRIWGEAEPLPPPGPEPVPIRIVVPRGAASVSVEEV